MYPLCHHQIPFGAFSKLLFPSLLLSIWPSLSFLTLPDRSQRLLLQSLSSSHHPSLYLSSSSLSRLMSPSFIDGIRSDVHFRQPCHAPPRHQNPQLDRQLPRNFGRNDSPLRHHLHRQCHQQQHQQPLRQSCQQLHHQQRHFQEQYFRQLHHHSQNRQRHLHLQHRLRHRRIFNAISASLNPLRTFSSQNTSRSAPIFYTASIPLVFPTSTSSKSPPKNETKKSPLFSQLSLRGSSEAAFHTSSLSEMDHSRSVESPVSMKGMTAAEKLERIRKLMREENIDALIVQPGDSHNSEIPSPVDQRRAFISNFDGSNGTALILADEALLWTDGRYYVQAAKQLDPKYWKLMKAGLPETPKLSTYLKDNAVVKNVGIDTFTTTAAEFNMLKAALEGTEKTIVHLRHNLVDKVWGTDRPVAAASKVYVHPISIAGQSISEKLVEVRKMMAEKSTLGLVVSNLDEVAWLLNLRGSDFEFSPVFKSYLFLTEKDIVLFIDRKKLTEEAADQLKNANVTIQPYEEITDFLKKTAETLLKNSSSSKKIWMGRSVSVALHSAIPEGRAYLAVTPVCIKKAFKNQVELQGMIEAHIRDAVALIKFLAYTEEAVKDKSIFSETEYSLAMKLDGLRAKQKDFMGLSFPTISSIGPNGAVIHYRPTETSSAAITPAMFLVDSGGQYRQGTTDVTRTVHFGEPTEFEKEAFTRVLKGHIALDGVIFPANTRGPQLDALARQFLWSVGLDYRHGTGHGVGAYLHVHEDPVGISPQLHVLSPDVTIAPGMILSNEPGFYDEDKGFGIRIENLVYTTNAETPYNYAGTKFYRFEPLTLVPLYKKLIQPLLLSQKEIEWINDYHAKVWKAVSPRLEEEQMAAGTSNGTSQPSRTSPEVPSFSATKTLEWLRHATSPMATPSNS